MSETNTATLAGGCFWCLEAVYQELKGVETVVSGFSGGHLENPSYRQVIGKDSGHAEVVQITFTTAQISYRDLLEVFFTIHDPTTLNRQGNDVGPQYRSAIFYHDDSQKKTAMEVIRAFEKEGVWSNPIVTEVTAFEQFYRAEDYHQNYYRNNPLAGYCQVVIQPKVLKFRKYFFSKLKQ